MGVDRFGEVGRGRGAEEVGEVERGTSKSLGLAGEVVDREEVGGGLHAIPGWPSALSAIVAPRFHNASASPPTSVEEEDKIPNR